MSLLRSVLLPPCCRHFSSACSPTLLRITIRRDFEIYKFCSTVNDQTSVFNWLLVRRARNLTQTRRLFFLFMHSCSLMVVPLLCRCRLLLCRCAVGVADNATSDNANVAQQHSSKNPSKVQKQSSKSSKSSKIQKAQKLYYKLFHPSNLKSQISNLKSQISNLKCKNAKCKMQNEKCKMKS